VVIHKAVLHRFLPTLWLIKLRRTRLERHVARMGLCQMPTNVYSAKRKGFPFLQCVKDRRRKKHDGLNWTFVNKLFSRTLTPCIASDYNSDKGKEHPLLWGGGETETGRFPLWLALDSFHDCMQLLSLCLSFRCGLHLRPRVCVGCNKQFPVLSQHFLYCVVSGIADTAASFVRCHTWAREALAAIVSSFVL
jgi:hypothetical protein